VRKGGFRSAGIDRAEVWRDTVTNKLVLVVVLFLGLSTVAVPAIAHHGNASYDFEKTVTLKGTVTSWLWSNPHCLLRFDVKVEKGDAQHWVTETSSPVDMLHIGWSNTILKPGDEITVDLMPSKNGTPVGRIRQITLSDGTILKATTRNIL